MIHFEPLNDSHFPLIHHWFNQPHVQAFYSLRSWTLEEVKEKLKQQVQKQIQGFIISLDQKPIGYIQSYAVKDHPWENQELSKEIVDTAAGFDLLIGDEAHLQQGLGTQIVERFLEEQIWPSYHYCIVDPNICNKASLKLFQKCGFQTHKEIQTKDALKRESTLQLLIKYRPDNLSP